MLADLSDITELAAPALPGPQEIIAGLDDDQALILLQTVDQVPRSALVNAGAGSGKTRLLISQIAYLIRTGRYRPEQILAITFTNKAAREMKERLLAMAGPDAVDRDHGVWVGTFHAICIRLLRMFGGVDLGWSSFHILDEDDSLKMLKAAATTLGLNYKGTELSEARRTISLWKNKMVSPKWVMETAQQENDNVRYDLGRLFERYMQVCRRSRGMDFDDILLYTVWALRKKGAMWTFCQSQFKHIFVDEFQDTNGVQLELCRLMRAPDAQIEGVGKTWRSLPT